MTVIYTHPPVRNNGLTLLEGYGTRLFSCKNIRPTAKYVDIMTGIREPDSRYICVNDLHSNTAVILSSFQNYTCIS